MTILLHLEQLPLFRPRCSPVFFSAGISCVVGEYQPKLIFQMVHTFSPDAPIVGYGRILARQQDQPIVLGTIHMYASREPGCLRQRGALVRPAANILS